MAATVKQQLTALAKKLRETTPEIANEVNAVAVNLPHDNDKAARLAIARVAAWRHDSAQVNGNHRVEIDQLSAILAGFLGGAPDAMHRYIDRLNAKGKKKKPAEDVATVTYPNIQMSADEAADFVFNPNGASGSDADVDFVFSRVSTAKAKP